MIGLNKQFIKACALNNIAEVESLIEKGVDINSFNMLGQTAFMVACKKYHLNDS